MERPVLPVGFFAQPRNAFSPSFLRNAVGDHAVQPQLRGRYAMPGGWLATPSAAILAENGFSDAFRDNYLIPPWPPRSGRTPRLKMLEFPASTFVTFFENHRLIHEDARSGGPLTGGLAQLSRPPAGAAGRPHPALDAGRDRDPRCAGNVTVWAKGREPERFDAIVLAGHSDQMLSLLDDASPLESAILSSVEYRPNRVVLHRDPRLMPRRKIVWSPWNYMRCTRPGGEAEVCVTYWMNELQGIDRSRAAVRVAQPGHRAPRAELTFGEWSFSHPPVRFRRDLRTGPPRRDPGTPPHLVRRRLDRFWLPRGRAALRPRCGRGSGRGSSPWRDRERSTWHWRLRAE